MGNSWSFGRLFQLLSNAADVTINHNTALQTEDIIFADGSASSRVVFTNNITPHSGYGIIGTGTGIRQSHAKRLFSRDCFLKNVLVGASPSLYPSGNKNGILLYTSAVAPSYPLLVDASFLTHGATLSNAVIQ